MGKIVTKIHELIERYSSAIRKKLGIAMVSAS